MPETGAERQRAWRDRRARLIAGLETDSARPRAELANVRGQLADALAETERLAAQQCRHPAAAVDGGHRHACGAEVWGARTPVQPSSSAAAPPGRPRDQHHRPSHPNR